MERPFKFENHETEEEASAAKSNEVGQALEPMGRSRGPSQATELQGLLLQSLEDGRLTEALEREANTTINQARRPTVGDTVIVTKGRDSHPRGWTEYNDNVGNIIYHHQDSGIIVSLQQLLAKAPLPPGWTEYNDSVGNVFYHNLNKDVIM